MNIKKILQKMMYEDEAIARFIVEGTYKPSYCIIPADKKFEWLDLGGAIEETFHRIWDQPISEDKRDEMLYFVLSAKPIENSDSYHYIDLGYGLPGEILKAQRLPLTDISFEEKIYQRFQMLWLIDHRYSLRDFGESLLEFARDVPDREAFPEWELNCGISGEIYPCLDEFLNAEYLDYDSRLFFNDSEKNRWKADLGSLTTP